MPVVYVNASAIAGTAGGTSLTPTLPSSLAFDIFIAQVQCANNDTIGTPSLWLKLTQITTGANLSNAYYLLLNPGSPSNPAFNWTTSSAAAAIVYCYRGVDRNHTTGGVNGSGGGANPHTTAGFTAIGASSLAIALDGQLSATAQGTVPSGWTQDSSLSNATSGMSFAAWHKQLGAAGVASGAISVTEGNVKWGQLQLELVGPQINIARLRQYLRR